MQIALHLTSSSLFGRMALVAAQETLRSHGYDVRTESGGVKAVATLGQGQVAELNLNGHQITFAQHGDQLQVDAPCLAALVGVLGAYVTLQDGRARWSLASGRHGPVILGPLSLSLEIADDLLGVRG